MKNKFFTLLVLIVTSIGNVQAYDLMSVSPSNHVLYYNVLDSENHTLSVTYPCLGGGGNYYYNYTKPEGDLIIPTTINTGQHTWTVIEITDHAFCECQITSVEIPNTVTIIGERAFYNCPITSLELPDVLTDVGGWAFAGTQIQHLTLPESINMVGELAFANLEMETLILPEKDVQYGRHCFGGTALESVVIPEGVTVISEEMFWGCKSLTNVSFPSTLTSIKHDAFAYCSALQEIKIPSSVVSIGDWSIGIWNPFRCTPSVMSINVEEGNPVYYSEGNCLIQRETKTIVSGCRNSVIPNDVAVICNEAFESGMSGTLYLPAFVNNIGERAFANCSSINKIYSLNTTPPSMYTGSSLGHSFGNVPRNIPVYVPAGCVEAYRNAAGWDEFEYIFEIGMFSQDAEWYYEIHNDDGSITYQYLSCAADTTINDQPIHILVRINTLYDKQKSETITREYVFEENNKVYWWNKTLGEFTTLYDFGAEVGDEWEIKVGTQTIPVHVDAAQTVIYKSQEYKMLSISDPDDIFTGDIICGIGHLTSFFPEKLMTKGYRVEGIRCFWQDGELVYQNGDQDCDEIYEQHHLDVDEIENEYEFVIYPNPSHDVLFVKTCHGASLQSDYRITNLTGQTIMIGEITSETQQIEVSSLINGMYFINIGNVTTKFLKN